MAERIYMPLLDEGVEVWRPVEAEREGDLSYRVLGPMPQDETWQFKPGEIVRVQSRVFSDGEDRLVAFASVASPS